MAISMDQVKELRERTGAGPMECKKVLEQANGDMAEALNILREKGREIGDKKKTREAREGRIEIYVHPGNRVVALVELNCETDFVGRNEAFVQLAKDIALHIAAVNPKYLSKDDVDAAGQAEAAKSPKFYEENVLLEQPFIKQPSSTIGEMVRDTIAKTRENIVVRRFVRYEVGE